MPKEKLDISVLYVEDEQIIRDRFALILGRIVSTVYVGENGWEGLELYRREEPDLVLSDVRMPEMTGTEMVRKIHEAGGSPMVVLTTAYNDREFYDEARGVGVEHFLIKPIDLAQLHEVLNICAERKSKQRGES